MKHRIQSKSLRIRTRVRAGGTHLNHNASTLRVRTSVRAGGTRLNHNTTRA